MDPIDKELIAAASNVRKNSYSPYSNYCVGAAVLTEDNEIVSGCNVENSAYPLTICAEKACLSSAISQGHKKFKKIAIVTENGGEPCGGCRQFIMDLCGDIPIILSDDKDNLRTFTSAELLPHCFKLRDK